MADGRVLWHDQLKGHDDFKGCCFCLAPGIVVTALHVVGDRVPELLRLVFDDHDVAVDAVEPGPSLDIAMLRVATATTAGERIGHAVNGDPWWVSSRPQGNDPVLTGRVVAVDRTVSTSAGEIELVQLTVDQDLAGFAGYSGSAVRLGVPGDERGVSAVLIEQVLQRIGWPGAPRPASNVLYAVPIERVIERFALTGLAVAPPRCFGVPRPPVGMILRVDAVGEVVRLLLAVAPGRPGGDVIVRAPGGMGKTVLAQQIGHDERLWQAFPGGVRWVRAGPRGHAEDVISQLEQLGQVASPTRPALVLIDDVWSDELLSQVRAQLPEPVRLLATTRGVVIEGMAGYPLHAMSADEALTVLVRGGPRTSELDAALRQLADALGHSPLLLDMASRYLHLTDLDYLPELSDGHPASDPAELGQRADQLRADFAAHPTILDEPGSVTRSLRQMVRRSLDALTSDEDRHAYDDLAVFPSGARLSCPVLADLWQLDPIAAQQRIVRLYRVGLVTVVGTRPLTVVMHDLHAAELHERRGFPESPALGKLHDRCAAPSLGAEGQPGELTEQRAEWLAYHLLRGSDRDAVQAILGRDWRFAYRHATGSDACYLRALRSMISAYGVREDRPIRPEVMVRAFLRRGLITAQVGGVPVDALIAYALLGTPAATLAEAAELPNPARAIGAILSALHNHQRLTREILDGALALAERQESPAGRVETVSAVASVLVHTDPARAVALARRADDDAAGLSADDQQQGWIRVPLITLLAAHEPDAAAGRAESVIGDVARCRAQAGVAVAVAGNDQSAAERLVERAASGASRNFYALGTLAAVIAVRLPQWATKLAGQAAELTDRICDDIDRETQRYYLCRLLAPAVPEVAADLTERMEEGGWRALAVNEVVGPLARLNSQRAIALADKLAEGKDRSRALAQVVASLSHTDLHLAEALTRQITDLPWRARALIELASAVMADNRDDGQRLADEAVRTATTDDDPRSRAATLRWLAGTWAGADPAEAGRLADLIPVSHDRMWALAELAATTAPTRPGLASAFLQRYEATRTIPWTEPTLGNLTRIAAALARHDMPEAAVLAQGAIALGDALPEAAYRSIVREAAVQVLARLAPQRAIATVTATDDEIERGRLFESLIGGLALVDTQQARDLIDQAPSYTRDDLRAAVAAATAGTDLPTTMGLLAAIGQPWTRYRALAAVAPAAAPHHPHEALALADEIPHASLKALANARIATALAPTDVTWARQLAADLAEQAVADLSEGERDDVLEELAVAYAGIRPERAMALHHSIAASYTANQCLERVVTALAPIDPVLAVQIVDEQFPDAPLGDANKADDLLAEIILRWPEKDLDRATAVADRLQQRILAGPEQGPPDPTAEGTRSTRAWLPYNEARLLGATWRFAPRKDVLAAVLLRHCSDLSAVLDVILGLLETWAEDGGTALATATGEVLRDYGSD